MRIFFVILLFVLSVYSYEIKKGWNLIGTTDDINLSNDIVLTDGTKTVSIWKYYNTSWKYRINGEFNNLLELNSGDGFWLKSLIDYTSNFAKVYDKSFTLDVKQGWNMLSSKNGKELNVSSLNVDLIWVYRDNDWYLYPQNGNYKTFDTIKSGEGFYIYSSSDKILSINDKTSFTSEISNATANNDSKYGTYNGDGTNGVNYTLLAWTDLGMHCLDDDFSIFSILPPYSNLRAQLIDKNNNALVTNGVILTFESTTKDDGSTNSTSKDKTNFWDFVKSLFNTVLNLDTGLNIYKVQNPKPQEMKYIDGYYEASGIPATPYNDNGVKDTYPMVRVVARDLSGNILASTKAVLPVSDEMDCKKCHASNSSADAKPFNGWENSSNATQDYRLNILKLHDEKHNIAKYLDELKMKGYDYNTFLYDTAKSGKPILCVSCHKSNALKTTGVGNLPQFTTAMHSLHAKVKNPTTGQVLGDSTSKDSCYMCHPGSETKCQRGAMNAISCQECHGGLNAVGSYHRNGWVDLPNCQSCHQDGKRYTTAVIDTMGTLRTALDDMFSTGTKLYKEATGHGKISCQACHGSTHAVYPSLDEVDNYQSLQLMGNTGVIGDCQVCHKTVPFTTNEGPHKMHSISQNWVDKHKKYAKNDLTNCKVCHGSDLKGTNLSKTLKARTYSIEHGGTKSFAKGYSVGCYECHNGLDDD